MYNFSLQIIWKNFDYILIPRGEIKDQTPGEDAARYNSLVHSADTRSLRDTDRGKHLQDLWSPEGLNGHITSITRLHLYDIMSLSGC